LAKHAVGYFFKALSMAATTSGASGLTRGEKRLMTLPSPSRRNFSKF